MRLTQRATFFLVSLGCVCLCPCSLAAEETADVQASCVAAEFRQLDFRLGRFEVDTASGQPAGWSRVESMLSGCLIVEHWHGSMGVTGQAQIFYDRNEALWYLQYVADDGETLFLAGQLQGESIVLRGENQFYDFVGMHQMRWSSLPDGDVMQEWTLSEDKGRTWQKVFTGIYRRVD